ncbi:histidine kinase [Bacillus sp. HMF5848]|uniref:sensor histidine kinase n=1 Tax=Bacillus sp. HMF5848 TaxID=2495421 RepID=UPI000F7912D4|nr:sensor histidine kinase [Bacillus sp. HMF5848]RSK28632.1 histidine kinase [Bacillus sp. HMF5848]
MATKDFDVKMLDEILEKMVETVHNSKDEIFLISEHSRQEFEVLKAELEKTREEVDKVITDGDDLEKKSKLARNRLSVVSSNFNEFGETQIREAYEKAHKFQMDLTIVREKERQLREKRDDLERRLRNLEATIERADQLVSQISVVLNYLDNDLRHVGEVLQDAKQKQEFGLRIIEAQEDERKRLSREIHDGPAQMLANVMMRSELIDRVFRERGANEGFQEIRELRKMVRSALYEVRRIIYDLRPMALDDLGLIPTLKKYLDTIEEYNKGVPKIDFNNLAQDVRLSSRLEVALFRLVQEAVQNTLKHADASHVQVKIEITKNHVMLMIKDDGVGFDPGVRKQQSYGIIGMKERVELLSGDITFQSAKDSGTTIRIKVPLTTNS